MLIQLSQLNENLKNWQAPYTIFGDELLLIEQTKKQIIKASKQYCGYHKNITLDGLANNPWQELIQLTKFIDLIDGKCLIIANIANGKVGKFSPIIQDLANQKADILFVLPKLDKTTKHSVWFNALEKNGTCVEIHSIDNAKMPNWIKHTAKELALDLDNETINWLAYQFQNNLISLYQELQKLSLAFNGQKITLADIQTSILDVSQYKAYDFINACIAGNKNLVVKHANFLRQDTPILCLWLLIEELILLLEIKDKTKTDSLYNVFKTLRIWGYKEKNLTKALQRLSIEKINYFLKECYKLEKQTKGAEQHSNNLWESLQLLCLGIAD